MTAGAMAADAIEAARSAHSAADHLVAHDQHLGHDFPYLNCCVCRFPVPPWDLAGEEYEHRHASTCTPTGHDAARACDKEWAS